MSQRLKRMQVLVDLAQREFDQALETLSVLKAQLGDHQQQYDSLKNYLSDYVERINNEGLALMPIQLQTTQTFLDKLNSAIFAQKQKITEVSEIVEKAEDNWAEKRARLKALEKLFQKIQKNEQVSLQKQEQKMLDDLASQQFVQKNPQTI